MSDTSARSLIQTNEKCVPIMNGLLTIYGHLGRWISNTFTNKITKKDMKVYACIDVMTTLINNECLDKCFGNTNDSFYLIIE